MKTQTTDSDWAHTKKVTAVIILFYMSEYMCGNALPALLFCKVLESQESH